MTNSLSSVDLLIKLKAAVDLMRDVRADDPVNQGKIRLAMATVESVMQALQARKPN